MCTHHYVICLPGKLTPWSAGITIFLSLKCREIPWDRVRHFDTRTTRCQAFWYKDDTLENRYGFWPQTGCVTVPGREAAFLVARQRFPYRSRFIFSVKNMENMLPCNAICDIMHIDLSRKIYCGANYASIGFESKFIKSNESSQNVNVRDVLKHFAPINRSCWQCINWNVHELLSKCEEW